ncbi:MAG: Ig-like domain-containing protein [Lachnospiraceae bacterium]|nr:Ig-like domain-containing protein [Lachnospiraceae bacterium]
MRKKSYKGKLRRVLPALLAAALWIEGTFGSVYAAESAPRAEQTVGSEEDAAFEETADAEPEETGTSGKENIESEETESPAVKEETEESGENAGTEEPDEGEASDTEEKETSGGTEGEEEDAPDTVSENTPEQEKEESVEEPDADVADALGEPPLMSGYGEGNTVYSYNSVNSARSGESGKRQTPGTVQIIQRYKEYPWSLDVGNSYSAQPSTKSPYKAGHLADSSLENAQNLLNFIRYVAGIPSDVTLSESYIAMAQTGALLNCVNGQLSHTPTKPGGFPDDLYETGKTGCSSSNIASGYGNIAKSLLNGWMYDGDSSNIDRMGHRRWVLNPSMEKTGFGAVGGYSAMYAFDRSGSTVSDFVAWPAQNMPIELMNGSGTPWTVSLGSDYGKADIQKVTVTLQNLSNNKTYTFSGTKAEGYFKVNTDGYGMANCIIFRPNSVSYNKASQFRVTITGLTQKDGTDAEPLSYDVNFFSLQDTPAEVNEVVLNKTELHLLLDTEERAKERLSATVKPGNAADKSLTWKSSDENVATVDTDGNVEAAGVGTATISATAANGKQGSCTVKVSQYTLYSDSGTFSYDEETGVGSLSFDLTTDAISKKLTVRDGGSSVTDPVQWKSENESVATVDAEGTVIPAAVGETMLWADVANGLKVFRCVVTVEDSKPPTLQMREESCTLRAEIAGQESRPGERKELRVYFTPADTKWKENIKWHSDNRAVAVLVKEDGTEVGDDDTLGENVVWVQAKAAGKTKITATIVDEKGELVKDKDGKTVQAVCTVTVLSQTAAPALSAAEQPVALTNTQTKLENVALPEGWSWKEPETALAQFVGAQPKKFEAVYQPGDPETTLPAETPLDVHFLTVSSLSAGMRKEGEEISSLQSGQIAECYVNYFGEETLKKFEGSEAPLKGNAAYQKYKQEIEKNLKWVSSNPKAAEVESVGNNVKVTARAAGTTTLKAQLTLGKKTFTASCKITVTSASAGALTVKNVDGFDHPDPSQNIYTGLLSGFQTEKANQVNSKIILTLPGATKVTAKSNNAKVVTVKASAVEGDGFAVSLIVKAAGTARITLTGNDAAKTVQEIVLVVADPEPGLSEETVTVNTLQNTGAAFYVYPAKDKDTEGRVYEVTGLKMASDVKSACFTLESEAPDEAGTVRCVLKAKSSTKNGTYKVKVCATANGTVYELPLTVKVAATKPRCTVKQKQKLNLFYQQDESPLEISTEETVTALQLTGCGDYTVVKRDDGYYLKARAGATPNSVKKGNLSITLAGYSAPLTMSFTVGVEKKAPKITWDSQKVTLYPQAGINKVRIGLKTPEAVSWDTVQVQKTSAGAKGNYLVDVDRENRGIIIIGTNLNQAENFKMQVLLKDNTNWADTVACTFTVKVSLGQPAITLTNKTLQLNTNNAYVGYDAAATIVGWKDGGELIFDNNEKDISKILRVSVYCDPKDAKANDLVKGSQAVFSVTMLPADQQYQKYQVSVRLNNRPVNPGTYRFIVQAAGNGKVWQTPLTLKIVNTAPDKAVSISAKGSIDVLNRENSFITLTPTIKAVNGTFVIPQSEDAEQDRKVELRGRDAHLFRAKWDAAGTKIELRAKRGETLVTTYQYSVTPVIQLRNVNGEIEEIQMPAVKFKVKQGSAKLTAAPKTALLYSGSYNSVAVDLSAALKGAPAPEIRSVTLVGNTDVFVLSGYTYDKVTGKGTLLLRMKDAGNAVKGKSYTLQLQVRMSEQADNMKPVTVRYTVKVK